MIGSNTFEYVIKSIIIVILVYVRKTKHSEVVRTMLHVEQHRFLRKWRPFLRGEAGVRVVES